jgi:hypothetical protein
LGFQLFLAFIIQAFQLPSIFPFALYAMLYANSPPTVNYRLATLSFQLSALSFFVTLNINEQRAVVHADHQ